MAEQEAPSHRLEDQLFKALASADIRLLLEYLRKGDRNDEDIKREIPVTGGSRMLMKNLIALGLVTEFKGQGGYVYRLDPKGLSPIRRWLEEMTAGMSGSRA